MATKRKKVLATPVIRIPVTQLNVGLMRNIPPYLVPSNAMVDCMDVTVLNNAIEVVKGWSPFEMNGELADAQGPVALIDELPLLNGSILGVFATPYDFYFRSAFGVFSFLTPTYTTGDVDVVHDSKNVTGHGTGWAVENVVDGDRIQIQADGDWYTVCNINYGGQTMELDRVYEGVTGNNVAYEARLLYDCTDQTRWVSAVFQDCIIATCLDVDTQYWDGATASFDTLVEGLRAGGVFTFKRRPIMVDTDETDPPFELTQRFPQRIRWPDIGTIDDFTVAPGSEAGWLDLDETPDWAVMGYTLGDYAAIYKERSIHLLSYVGYPYVFQRREVISGIGAMSRRCVINMGTEHIFMGNDDFYVFNGIDILSIGETIREEVYRLMDPARKDEVLGFYREDDAVAEFIIPLASGGFGCWMYHYGISDPDNNQNVWTKRTLPATACGYSAMSEDWTWNMFDYAWASASWGWTDKDLSALFDLNLFGNEDGVIFAYGVTDDWNGVAIDAWVKMGAVGGTYPDVQIQHLIKEMKSVEPWADIGLENQTIRITAGYADRIGGEFTYPGEYQDYQLDMSGYPWVNFTQPGRVFSLKFATDGNVGNRWRLAGYLAEVAVGGRV